MKTIKRYSNRKLYDIGRKRYIKLDDIEQLVCAGEEVRVVDNDTQADLTTVTLAQILVEREKRGASPLPKSFFVSAVRTGARRRP
jgi:polyhydroxyalkanoate synthesis repressor PhaR